MRKFYLSMEKKQVLEGYVFVSPFIIGLLVFFAYPLYISVKLSLGKITRMAGFSIEWSGFEHYIRAFIIDVNFIPMFLNAIRQTLTKVPLIIVFSLLIAILVNKSIRFRGFFRTAFFIPFLLGTGEVMRQLLNQDVDLEVLSLAGGNLIPREFLIYMGPEVVQYIDTFFGMIVVVLWSSGVQILLFLSGLQSIPVSLYESSKVDGATEWDMFWKITLPMISPIILLNIIYSLVDSFAFVTNPILSYIQSNGFKQANFEYAAALGWIYFGFIILLVVVVMGVLGRYVYVSDVKGAKNK